MGSNPNNYDYGKNPYLWPKPFHGYEYKTLTVSGTDFSLKDNTELFSLVSNAYIVAIKNGAEDILVRYNGLVYDQIPIMANAPEFKTSGIMVTDIFVTVSGVSTLDVMLLGWK